MWDFLRFHPEKPTVRDIEVLENYLDDLRTLMVQKSAGQSGREAKTAGAIDFDDLEMTMNAIIIQTMWIYLAGGTNYHFTARSSWKETRARIDYNAVRYGRIGGRK
jgi:hypothetical protein